MCSCRRTLRLRSWRRYLRLPTWAAILGPGRQDGKLHLKRTEAHRPAPQSFDRRRSPLNWRVSPPAPVQRRIHRSHQLVHGDAAVAAAVAGSGRPVHATRRFSASARRSIFKSISSYGTRSAREFRCPAPGAKSTNPRWCKDARALLTFFSSRFITSASFAHPTRIGKSLGSPLGRTAAEFKAQVNTVVRHDGNPRVPVSAARPEFHQADARQIIQILGHSPGLAPEQGGEFPDGLGAFFRCGP